MGFRHSTPISKFLRLVVSALVAGTVAGAASVAVALPASASVVSLYAYAAGAAVSPSGCPQSTVAADECTLAQALALAPAGAKVLLATSGSGGFYYGNFTFSSSVTVAPASGVVNPTVQGYGCKSCFGPTLDEPATVGGNALVVTLEDLTVGANFTSDPESAGIDVAGAAYLVGVTVANSSTQGEGGGAYVATGASLTVSRSTFSNDHSGVVMNNGSGGAIFNDGTLTVNGSTFSNDQNGFGTGGAIFNGGTGMVAGSTFLDVTSELGGAIDNVGTLTIRQSTFSGDLGNGDGGAIDNEGTLTVRRSTFADDSAVDTGGAIENSGTLSVVKSTFSNDVTGDTDGAADEGGAINNSGALTVSGSTFSANSAGGGGQSYFGGAIENGESGAGGTLSVLGSTFAGNLGQDTIDNASGTLAIAGSILEDSSTAECSGTITDAGFNLEQDAAASCSFAAAKHDLVGVSAQLGSLQDNGGLTETLEPGSSSPVLDQIPNPTAVTIGSSKFTLCPGWDQRAVPAPPFLYGCAIGSVDVPDTSAPIMRSVTPSSGSAAGGTPVVIRGVNFPTGGSGVSAVDFGGVPALSFTVVSSNKIVALAPTGTAGTAVLVTVNVSSLWRPKDVYTYT